MLREKTVFIVSIVLLFLFTSTVSYGADNARIGVIDFRKILDLSDAGKAAQVEIRKLREGLETDLKKKMAEIEEMEKRLEREDLVISKETRLEREREIMAKINDFRSFERRYNEKMIALNRTLIERLQEDVFELVEKIGKEGGYLLIVERVEAGVLYFPKAIDITDSLIQQLNARFAREAEKHEDTTQ